MVNKALLIAYHYPPVRVSSGLQRTLAFSQYLKEYGWHPMILSAHPRAYSNISEDQLKDIPDGMIVKRAFALDAQRHFSCLGRYPGILALPDRWTSWWFGGVLSGLKMIRRYSPSVIWSTYPIATAHLIALTLHNLTGLPWVADFRDSMTEENYPEERSKRAVLRWVEKKAIASCSSAVFTTPSAIKMYQERYPEVDRDKYRLIPNGYNEEIFSEVEKGLSNEVNKKDDDSGTIVLVHSGVLYPSERDPRNFFLAISKLKENKLIDNKSLKIILRATGHDKFYKPLLEQYQINDIVELMPGIAYREALQEMMQVDGLLIFQATNCNHQVPAKIYEYFRAKRPVLALTDSKGDTARILREAGVNDIVSLDDEEAIRRKMVSFLSDIRMGKASVVTEEKIKLYSRKYSVGVLASIFEDAISTSV